MYANWKVLIFSLKLYSQCLPDMLALVGTLDFLLPIFNAELHFLFQHKRLTFAVKLRSVL